MAELDLTNIAAASIATPASGVTAVFVDSTGKQLTTKDDAGITNKLVGQINNFSTTAQSPTAATLTYIIGSNLAVPVSKMRIGTMFRWRFNMTKTAAGIAASTFNVVIGTLGTTGDTARLTFTKPAGTAAIDEGWVDIIVTVRGPLSASGIIVGQFNLIHNLQITGHAVIPCVSVNAVSAAFDVTVASLIVGLTVTTGASDAITIQMVQAEAVNL